MKNLFQKSKSHVWQKLCRVGVILLFNLLLISSSGAWNRVWENVSRPGTARSPVACRNLGDNGTVTASFVHHYAFGTFTPTSRVTFIEVDDAGNEVIKSEMELFPGGNVSERIELMRILPWPQEDAYLLMGSVHDPNNYNVIVGTFLAKLDNVLNTTGGVLDCKIFPNPDYSYWDFGISPITNRIVMVGSYQSDLNFVSTNRQAVVTVLDNTLTTVSHYGYAASVPGTNAENRFDAAKCVEITVNSSNVEYVNVAGNFSRLINGNYTPHVFVSRFQLTAGGLLNPQWIQQMYNNDLSQMMPADIICSEDEEYVFVTGGISPNIGINEATYWQLSTAGLGQSCGQYEGIPVNPLGMHEMRPYQVELLSNGNIKICGWAYDYFQGSLQINKYNFFEIDYNPANYTFANLRLHLGYTDGYSALFGTGFFSVETQWPYYYNGNMNAYGYHAPRFFTTWYTGETQETSWAWPNMSDAAPINPLRHEIRIKCTIAGTGDGGDCDAFEIGSSSGATNPVQNTGPSISLWNNIYPIFLQNQESVLLPDPQSCDGVYN